MSKVMLIGEPMVMFYADEYGPLSEVNHFSKGLAGAEVNVGIGLSRLGHNVSYLTKLNQDPMGQYIYNYLEKEELASELIIRDSALPVGVMYKNKVKKGDPDTLYYRKGSAASTLKIEDVEQIDFSLFDVLHMTGIPPALSQSLRETSFYMIKEAKKKGCLITFDPNLRPSLWEDQATMIETVNELASISDVFLPGLGEASLLSGLDAVDDITEFYLAKGIKTVIVKDGASGAHYRTKDKKGHVPGFHVSEIVDTVGAGDGFAVGIIDGLLNDFTLEHSLTNANAIGAIQVQDASDNEALPTNDELAAFIKESQT
ncbi:sugar kinase [Vagococcus lutrae]|uniref:sugar kinase n=1 Tax=Vagococcus lutrae TaxID=81947 RepID=UPI000F86BF8A|nr:sugar kinase [Vagococcus lutrae]MDT2811944.1 sugar kinase [Vagococcus lutrae]RST91272.1 2-dehydro-3-deoxygluconokinase [Vagococcus lutrae]UQF23149.1 sugar kinase [Vagococcus lutrae]UQF64767.1 sugar kinase [Vagococcus lutrae]